MPFPTRLLSSAVALTVSFACGASGERPAAPAVASQSAPAAATGSAETKRLNAFFVGVFMRTVNRSPGLQAYLGIKKDADKWDDISDDRAREDVELARGDLESLQHDYHFDQLDTQGKLSYRLFERTLRERIEDFEWRFHSYPVNQMFGMHSQVPAFLANFHKVESVKDARDYIARLQGLPGLFAQLETNLAEREQRGVVPPKFVFPMVIEDCRNVLVGAPFDKSGADSPIFADFHQKVGALEGVEQAEKDELLAAGDAALVSAVKPAYESLIGVLERQQAVATTDDGVWKLPRGAEFYARALQVTTTTDMTAEEIHNLGLREVARIHEEMRALMKQVGFGGSLQEFFRFVRTDKQFFFSNTEEGRQAYLTQAEKILAKVQTRLDRIFVTKAKAGLVVKRVEPYREKSAGAAFYNPPSLDGSRAGIYYVNLYDMNTLPKYEMEALALHEGIPGHHMQNAISMQLEDLPMFRRVLGYTAYGEGWGLYSEWLGKEIGMYADPYSDFGRLSMELWRACRLVVDTGIHHKRWTREQAIAWLGENTPGSERDVRKAVERYIVSPSQATAYKIGMMEIQRLRRHAEEELGDRFDVREFHEAVLTNGPLPLTILAEIIDQWIAEQRGS